MIDPVARTLHRPFERPVLLIGRAFFDPPLEQRLLVVIEFLVRLRRWHDLVGGGRVDQFPSQACSRVSRHNRGHAILLSVSAFRRIETQLGLSLLLVESVTSEAVLREDRADVAIELQWFGDRACEGAQ